MRIVHNETGELVAIGDRVDRIADNSKGMIVFGVDATLGVRAGLFASSMERGNARWYLPNEVSCRAELGEGEGLMLHISDEELGHNPALEALEGTRRPDMQMPIAAPVPTISEDTAEAPNETRSELHRVLQDLSRLGQGFDISKQQVRRQAKRLLKLLGLELYSDPPAQISDELIQQMAETRALHTYLLRHGQPTGKQLKDLSILEARYLEEMTNVDRNT